jgi:oligopeptide/dipeptide ABC transporter ATP-binding protein
VDGISYEVEDGEFLGIVGESGCGKSVSALSIMGLITDPPGKIVGGRVVFNGRDLLNLTDVEMRKVRGNQISMVFQEPMTSLNPVLTIGRQLTEMLELHLKMGSDAARERAADLLSVVGFSDPNLRLKDYPHQLSGGMLQRIMIAMAISCNPALMIADEPTTALDVTIQAQILELIRSLSKKLGMALILITHNLGVVARYADRVIVMYAGKIVEMGLSSEIYGDSRHPYTLGLLNSVPRLDEEAGGKLEAIEGRPPDLIGELPIGCRFAPRCKFAITRCTTETPELMAVEGKHFSACWRMNELPKIPAQMGRRGYLDKDAE